MRDILLTIVVFGTIPYILKKPYIGILVWSWLGYMNPHRLTYGFARSMPYAQIIAIVLFVSFLFYKDKKMFPVNTITVIWMIFIIWMGITTFFAYYPGLAWIEYLKILKIQVVIFFTMALITDLQKLRLLIWVIVLSIGFFTVKGGVFTLLSGGGHRVWGPDNSFWGDNNAVALAGLMVFPLMFYLYKVHEEKWIKYGLFITMIFTLFTVVGTQSRGALVAIAAVAVFFWFKSNSKFISGIVIMLMGLVLLSFLPDSWFKRMDTIATYDQDASAMGRINAWQYSINAANDNFTGVGLNSWSLETFMLYAPNPTNVLAAHSIFFSVVADHGWPGAFMFVLIFYLLWRKLTKAISRTNGLEYFKEINLLARMLQVSFIAYFAGGAFLSLSYFDLPWHLVSFVILLDTFIGKNELLKTA